MEFNLVVIFAKSDVNILKVEVDNYFRHI